MDKEKTQVFSRHLAKQVGLEETEKHLELLRRRLRESAFSRISGIHNIDWYSKEDKTLHYPAKKVLKLYGFTAEEAANMSVTDSHKLALKFVASDILITEFYGADGKMTDFAENNYPNVNAQDYVLVPGSWPQVRHTLEKKLKTAGWISGKLPNQYLGMVSSEEDEKPDIVAEYAGWFGKQSVIAIPFKISLTNSSLDIYFEDDFIEPYGGKPSIQRLVFVPKETGFA